jgi:hypothetical protein
MSHPLDGCWAKIKRADHNIDRLNQLITSFLDVYGRNFGQEMNDHATEYIYSVNSPPLPPLDFRVRIGEIISHLRSSLDHLVWALVLQRHKSPTFRVIFPICEDIAKYRRAIKDGAIQGVSGSAQAIIERLQPYHRTRPASHPLAILHNFNNVDKHKLLLVVSSYTRIGRTITFSGEIVEDYEIDILPKNWSRRMIRTVEGRAELFRVRFARPVKVSMYAEFVPQIAFEEFGPRRDEPVIPSLVKLRDAVVKTIELFDAEF